MQGHTRSLDVTSKCSENQWKGYKQKITRLIEVKSREQIIWGGCFVSPGETNDGGWA